MESPTRSIQAKHRRVFIFSLGIISFMLMSCFYSGQDAAEAENATPKADISNGLVMTGTASITFYKTNTCTNAGTAVLTVKNDSSFVLEVTSPEASDLCALTGDQVIDKLYGTVNTQALDMNITSCLTDRQPVGEADGWITAVDAGGGAICYSVGPNGERGSKFFYVTFDVKK